MAIRIPVHDHSPSVAFEDAVQFVLDALADVPEFRGEKGRQIELKGTLALAVLAMTAGHATYREIEAWGKLREPTLIPLLGLVRAPSDSTIRRVVQGVEPEAVRLVLRASARMLVSDRRKLVTAKDGKTMRASRIEDRRSAHVVSVVEHNTGVIMDADYCREGEGELTAARRLQATAAAGKAEIVAGTADALYANSPDAESAVDGDEHYLAKVKKTRPSSSKTSACASRKTTPPSRTRAARAISVTAA